MEAAIAEVALFASSHLRPKLWGGVDGVGVPGAHVYSLDLATLSSSSFFLAVLVSSLARHTKSSGSPSSLKTKESVCNRSELGAPRRDVDGLPADRAGATDPGRVLARAGVDDGADHLVNGSITTPRPAWSRSLSCPHASRSLLLGQNSKRVVIFVIDTLRGPEVSNVLKY